MAARECIADYATHFLLRWESEKINTVSSNLRIVGERENGYAGLTCYRCEGAYGSGEQRAENQLSSLADGLFCSRLGSFRRALVVLHNELEVWVVMFEKGQLRSLLHCVGDRRSLST